MSGDSATFLCTRRGDLIRLDRDRDRGSWSLEPALAGVGAQCVAAAGSRVLVGTRDRGLLVSADAGASWNRVDLPEPGVFSVAIAAGDRALYAGTEPSRLFVSHDGDRWAELEALQRIPSRDRWSYPPRPWTHHVRSIAPDPHRAGRILVGIELGGLMYTDDAGAGFSDHRPGAKRDTHGLVWHPRVPGIAYQAAGDGAAWSRDGGRTWHPVDDGRELGYCWALAVDPSDPERWYVSAATGPGAAHSGEHARGRLYRCEHETWHALSLPTDTMPYALIAGDGELLAALADGHILHSVDRGTSWSDTGAHTAPVVAMAAG